MQLNQAPMPLSARLEVFWNPMRSFKRCSIMAIVFERCDEVEPWLVTNIVETWLDKTAVSDQDDKWRCDSGENPLFATDAYMRLAWPEGQEVTELIARGQIYDLPTDDLRMEDILHVQRRSTNRELAASGQLAAKVDALEEDNTSSLAEFAPHIAGVLLPLLSGVFYFLTLTTGGS